jgi:hypothetical protein
MTGFDLLVIPCRYSLGPATRVVEGLSQFGFHDDSGQTLSNRTSENRNLVAQTPEFDIGEISVNPPNDSFREQVWKLVPV